MELVASDETIRQFESLSFEVRNGHLYILLDIYRLTYWNEPMYNVHPLGHIDHHSNMIQNGMEIETNDIENRIDLAGIDRLNR